MNTQSMSNMMPAVACNKINTGLLDVQQISYHRSCNFLKPLTSVHIAIWLIIAGRFEMHFTGKSWIRCQHFSCLHSFSVDPSKISNYEHDQLASTTSRYWTRSGSTNVSVSFPSGPRRRLSPSHARSKDLNL